MSAIGADPASASGYARTKGEGERSVLEIVPQATILRPSIVFGAEDQFFNRFADMARLSPFIPLIGGGLTRFQPVYVADVAEAVAATVDGTVEGGKVYELGGPEILTFKAMMEAMLVAVHRKRRLLNIPFGAAGQLAKILQYVPGAPLTPDQVTQLKNDNVVSDAAIAEHRTIAAFGIQPLPIQSILPTYLIRFRPQGQFTTPEPQAGGLKRDGEAA